MQHTGTYNTQAHTTQNTKRKKKKDPKRPGSRSKKVGNRTTTTALCHTSHGTRLGLARSHLLIRQNNKPLGITESHTVQHQYYMNNIAFLFACGIIFPFACGIIVPHHPPMLLTEHRSGACVLSFFFSFFFPNFFLLAGRFVTKNNRFLSSFVDENH